MGKAHALFLLVFNMSYFNCGLARKFETTLPPGYGSHYFFHANPDHVGSFSIVYVSPDVVHPFDKAPLETYIANADEKQIEFYLYTRNTQQIPEKLIVGDADTLKKSSFVKNAPLKILCHGFRSNHTHDFPKKTKDKYLEAMDVNVISIDWSVFADTALYYTTFEAANVVGKKIGDLVNFLVLQKYTTFDNVHYIGHSLGAHVGASFANEIKPNKISRLTGLDPAAPGYLDVDSKEVRSRRLNPSCATFVDVIHTSSAAGLAAPLGNIDFYPNGGNEQPGCPEIRSIWSYFIDKVHNTVCSHGRSHEYWAESIIEQHHWFASCKCSEAVDDLNEAAAYDPEDDEKKYIDGKCDCNHLIEMGERAGLQKESGIFFLTTNPQFPFAKTKIESTKKDEL